MTTLITGATGFLGAHLVRHLVGVGVGVGVVESGEASTSGSERKRRTKKDKPPELRALVQSSPPPWLTDLGVETVSGSVTDAAAVARALEGVDRVYHLAGLVSHKPADAHRMHEVHVRGSRVLCEEAARAGVARVVMASTSGTVAVSRRADEMPDETSPTPMEIIARWPYYASKAYQEEAARRACGDKVELITVNPSLLLGRDIALVPPGGLNFVDVRDVAALLPVAMERGAAGERYLVGGHNLTFAEFLGRLERITKVPGPRLKAPGGVPWLSKVPLLATRAQAALYRHWGRTPPLEPQSVEMSEYFWYFDSGKAARDLGFIPREAADTLFDTVTYIRANLLGHGALGRKAV